MKISPMQERCNIVHMQKHVTPTTLAEFVLTPIIATLIIDGIRPPIPYPLIIMPRYSTGNIPNRAVVLPMKSKR